MSRESPRKRRAIDEDELSSDEIVPSSPPQGIDSDDNNTLEHDDDAHDIEDREHDAVEVDDLEEDENIDGDEEEEN